MKTALDNGNSARGSRHGGLVRNRQGIRAAIAAAGINVVLVARRIGGPLNSATLLQRGRDHKGYCYAVGKAAIGEAGRGLF